MIGSISSLTMVPMQGWQLAQRWQVLKALNASEGLLAMKVSAALSWQVHWHLTLSCCRCDHHTFNRSEGRACPLREWHWGGVQELRSYQLSVPCAQQGYPEVLGRNLHLRAGARCQARELSSRTLANHGSFLTLIHNSNLYQQQQPVIWTYCVSKIQAYHLWEWAFQTPSQLVTCTTTCKACWPLVYK